MKKSDVKLKKKLISLDVLRALRMSLKFVLSFIKMSNCDLCDLFFSKMESSAQDARETFEDLQT